MPRQIEPALFGQVQDQHLHLTLVGGNLTGRYRLKLFDVLGRLVQQTEIKMNLEENALRGDFVLPELPSGTYMADLQYRQTHFSTRFTVTR